MHHDLMNRPDNHEAKMARADLFKLAQYSFKLFKMINENQELEGWVQAKITKAADYIASVYHYMEYEMKVNEYGDAVENSDMYSETIRRSFQQKLVEAKEMAKKAKAKAEKAGKELDENMAVPQNPDGATAPPPKGKDGRYPIVTSGPNKGKRWSPQTPGPTNPAMKEGLKGGQSKLDADKDGKLEKSDFAKLRAGKKVKEEFDKVGDTKKTKTGELTKTDKGVVHKRTDYTDDEHGEAPSTVKQKSAAEKKADKSNDIKLPKHKGNTWGMKGGEKFGKKMESAKPDFLDMDKDGDKKEPMKKAVADKKKNPFAKVKENTQAAQARADRANVANTMANQTAPSKPGATTPVGEGKCNHTPKGKSCPIHGMKECGGMYEGDKFDPLKHVKNPTKGEKDAAKDVKRGSYGDRAAMLKSAEKDGRLKG